MSGPSLHRSWPGPSGLRSTIPPSRRLLPVRLLLAHLRAFLLLGQKHALAVWFLDLQGNHVFFTPNESQTSRPAEYNPIQPQAQADPPCSCASGGVPLVRI
jgi:hypothetical protein